MSDSKNTAPPSLVADYQNQLALRDKESEAIKAYVSELEARLHYRDAELEHLKRSVLIAHGTETWNRYYRDEMARFYINQLFRLAASDPQVITIPSPEI